jgi:hypothetical protein
VSAEAIPRKSRAAPLYSLQATPFAFWNVLFPKVTASAEETIAGWLVTGLLRTTVDEKLGSEAAVVTPSPAEWSVSVDSKGLTLSFPELKQMPVLHRPLFLKPALLHVPSFKEGHPIEKLKASSGSNLAQDNVRHLFLVVMSEIDRILLAALKAAIVRGDLVVKGVPAGDPFAARSQLRLGESNRISFGPGTPDLTAIEISRVAAEPGKAKSFEQADAPFVEMLKAMLDKDPRLGIMDASEVVAEMMAGSGTVDSKARRLRNRFKRAYPDWKPA